MKKVISFILIAAIIMSIICVGITAASPIHIEQNMKNMSEFTNRFCMYGSFTDWINGLYGYSEASELYSLYSTDNTEIIDNSYHTWLCYDAAITLSFSDDDLCDTERYIGLAYLNDNPRYFGECDERITISFFYDITEGCFRLTNGWGNRVPEEQLQEPIFTEIPTMGEDRVTFGISVSRGNIRCYCNGEMIFDYKDTYDLYRIAEEVNSPFIFRQDGNFVAITNIIIAEKGTLFSSTAEIGDANADGFVNLNDVAVILKYCAKWDLAKGFIYTAADANSDSAVNASDSAYLLRCIAGWYDE